MTLPQRLDALERAGMRAVAVVRFTRELSQWEPETFVRAVLVDWLHVSEVWVGANFLRPRSERQLFAAADARSALRLSRRQDRPGPLQGVRRQQYGSAGCGRTRGRGRCTAGTLYALAGTIVEGRRRGRELGFPTANLRTDNELIPPHGVYATTLTVDGIVRRNHQRWRESHVWRQWGHHDRNARAALQPRAVRSAVQLGFVQRLRDERRFDDVDALRAQIEADCRRAERLLRDFLYENVR